MPIDKFKSNVPALTDTKNRRLISSKKSEVEQINNFWIAPTEAFFGQETIARM